MQYPGNPELSAEAQDRVLTTFKQAIQKLHAGAREESMIALEFVLRLDPQFGPARQLHEQLTSGAEEVDLSSIVGQLQESSDIKVDQLLVDAVDDYNERRFHQAREKVQQVLKELPGHKEARDLLAQIEESLKTEAQVGQYLVQAREALDRGEAEESANFVMMAQALDPHHPGISPILADLEAAGAFLRQEPVQEPVQEPAQPEEPPEQAPVMFETTDLGSSPPVDWEAAEPAAPPAQGFDDLLGEPSSANTDWSFEEPSPPSPESDGGEPAGEPDFGMAEPEALPGGSGVDDLFDASDDSFFEPMAAASPQQPESQFQDQLIAGRNAFEAGDYRTAIDRWSRIFLSDPENPEARRLIEDARRQKEEHDRQVEELLDQAEEALTSGRSDDARQLLAQVSHLDPGNIHALELVATMGEGPPQPAPEAAGTPEESIVNALDDLDIDLFDEAAPAADTGPSHTDGQALPDLDDLVNTMDEA
ncbi:MAG TPA: hypothetical protein ENK19_01635, partial [Acidobacteria bacterium]|nr:hypothetical protein [Acidobacteriota bacterium]